MPEGVRICFADTGIGIEADRLASIFEPFHSTRPEGLGLGLYIIGESSRSTWGILTCRAV